jgi:hypothetical protein
MGVLDPNKDRRITDKPRSGRIKNEWPYLAM